MLTRRPVRPARQQGFSLIELMVTVSVMVLLSLLAVPSMSQYVENSKIHGTAEVVFAAMQKARTEAIRRNATVELVFTDQAPTPASVDTTGVTTTGPNWLIRQVPPPSSTASHLFIEGKSGAEGSGRPAGGSSTTLVASSGAVAFTPYGALSGAPFQVDFCAPSGAARCLKVVVSRGGQARLCDPAVTAIGDTRKC
ncbi:conserved hypothetical protein [Burkholderiales bacterium 8X]|nr:conserved hypothetical protein [Burkholderiales bacterium 8X]